MKKKLKLKFHDIVYGIIPENTDDIFIDMKSLEYYRTSKNFWDKDCYNKLVLGLGKNVFVFDVKSCDFFFTVCYVGEEPKMEVCDIEE